MSRRILLSFLLLAFLLAGLLVWRFVFPDLFRRNRLRAVVSALQSPDIEVREKAVKALEALAKAGLTRGEGRYAIKAAAETFPPLKFEWRHSPEELLSAAASSADPSFVAPLLDHFGSYSPPAQAAAIRLLASIQTRAAAVALVDTLRRCADETDPGELRGLSDEPRHADVLFPAILGLLSRDSLRWPILKVTLDYLEAGRLKDPDLQRRIAQEVGRLHQTLRPGLLSAERLGGVSWLWGDEYQSARSLGSLAFDVLGHLSAPDAAAELRQALEYRDPRLRLFAALGLMRSGSTVSSSALSEIASAAECRSILFRGMRELSRLSDFPRPYATQASLAESEMVNWLIFPTELGRAPDEIELMAVVPATSKDGPTDYFLFRFRTAPPHWAAKDGWVAGVAGPFLVKAQPTPDGGGDTFSTFTPWDSQTIQEHVNGVTDLLDRSRQLWLKDP